MALPEQWQIDHINEHVDAFNNHAGGDRTPEEYLTEYAYYKDGNIYERLCHDLGIEPRTGPTEGSTVADTDLDPSTRKKLEMQLQLGMNEDGSDLTEAQRVEIEALLGHEPDESTLGIGAAEEVAHVPSGTVETGSGDLQAMIQAAVQQAVVGLGQPATPQPQTVSLEDVLLAIDPKDSDSALMLFEWLQATGRLSVVATLTGNGGYLFHYSEPKGSTKQGYIPGGTKGGRMVDAALEAAKESGAKPKDQGLCGKCWSAVEREDGSPQCPQGGVHTFNA